MNVKIPESADWRSLIIAQDDDEDYEEYGWVALIYEGVAYLGNYGHCSCYGTGTALTGEQVGGSTDYDAGFNFTWSGTPAELVALAKGNRDPAMPERESNPNDSDYDHLQAVYAKIIEWANKEMNK